MKSFDIALIAVCAALYAVVGYLTSFGLTFGGVAFWPAAFIPAIFAVLFGPWVGGLGAAIGIFIRDMAFHGDPLLSITAGVTANFAMFFIIGYTSHTNVDRKKMIAGLVIGIVTILAGLLIPTLLLPAESAGFAPFSTSVAVALFASLVGVSMLLVTVMVKYWREFRSFGVGSIIGQGVGAAIVAIGAWGYSQLFFSSTGYFSAPLPVALVPLIFVWTFATEIPFVLLLGPPIIKACYRAFPHLRTYSTTKKGRNDE